MGNTYKIGKSPNETWQLDSVLGNEFENWIFQIISNELKPYYSVGTTIKQTPVSNDGGKDIIINTKVDLPGLLNQNFYLKEKSEIKIYIECKSSNQTQIRYEKIIGNVIKTKYDNIDYFVLVTNSSILPSTYYRIQEELSFHGITFLLVDQYLLASYLKELHYDELKNIPICQEKIDFYTEYQVFPEKVNGKSVYDIYIIFRNYTPRDHMTSVHLLTDKNWELEEDSFSFILAPRGAYSKKISVVRIFSDGIEDLLFQVKTDINESVVQIHGTDLKEVFEPPFIGKSYIQTKQRLFDEITQGANLQIFYLWGEAGIGKTRITQELIKELEGKLYDICSISLKYKKRNPTEEIYKFLYKNRYVKNKKYDNLIDIVKESLNPYRRAVIILDDFHYAEKNFEEELKILETLAAPITFIVCGRTDYSEGELHFFSFVQWTLENRPDNSIEIQSLEDEETKKLIRAMINHVPDEVMHKICKMSMNNPLYIAQFIEYLLETTLVALINRNTVGILNIETFSTKVFIPDKISQIYKRRLLHLQQSNNGICCINFLLLLTIFGGDIPSLIANDYLGYGSDILDILLKRRFIQRGNNRNLIFIHESLLLYLKTVLSNNKNYRKMIAESIFLKFDLLKDQLSDFEIGRLYLWINNKREAKKYFKAAQKELLEINNYSNYNADIKLYDYLYDIYKLYKGNKKYIELLKKILSSRIYMTLHYFAPVRSVSECNYCLELIDNSSIFQGEVGFKNTLLSLKAHSLLNAGKLPDGELILKELLSDWLIHRKEFDTETLFDILDRMTSVYIKYNCFQIAQNYNEFEISVAQNFKDNSLLVMAHRTRSKLFFYQDLEECKKSLDFVKDKINDGASIRIYSNNLLSELTYQMIHDENCNWQDIQFKADSVRKIAGQNSFNSVLIRAYLVLSVCNLKLSTNKSDLTAVKALILKGIDACIRFGVPNYVWQYYNLLAIVDTRLNYNTDHISKLFETVYLLLARQNLLYIGNRDFCYCNLPAISNIGFFLQNNGFESTFNSKMSKITYSGYTQNCDYNCANSECGYICPTDSDFLKQQYQKAKKKSLLFAKQTPSYLLRDDETHYFITLS